jgi:hypothetical protein
MDLDTPRLRSRLVSGTRAARNRRGLFASFGRSVACLTLVACTGCPPPPPPVQFLPRQQAVDIVNANNRRIGPGIRCKAVTADIRVRDNEGVRHHFILDGPLVHVKPRSLYFDLRQLGSTAIRVGSNPVEYWLWIKPERDTVWWGKYDLLVGLEENDIPIRPDELIEALGIRELPTEPDYSGSPLYRVADEYHQLIFFGLDDLGRGVISKEYWLDRRPPFLIRRIVFRDRQARVLMHAELDAYQAAADAPDVLMASRIRVRWPEAEGSMDLRIGRWENSLSLPPDAAAFQRPQGARRYIQVDSHLEPPA